jgi:two-component system, NarL family, nitrate/nitrite response regulator NarL
MPEELLSEDPAWPLSPREVEVLRELTKGATNRKIARSLDIAEGTVRSHIQNLLGKLKVRNRAEAVLWAASVGRRNAQDARSGPTLPE